LEEIGLDEYAFLCELRHCGTHRTLPPLNMLIIGAETLLFFLFKDYWLPKYQETVINQAKLTAFKNHFY